MKNIDSKISNPIVLLRKYRYLYPIFDKERDTEIRELTSGLIDVAEKVLKLLPPSKIS